MIITRRKLQVVSIILLLILNIAIFINGRQLSPDECVINFKSEKPSGLIHSVNTNFTIKIIDLYGGYKDGECPVFWSETEGYKQG